MHSLINKAVCTCVIIGKLIHAFNKITGSYEFNNVEKLRVLKCVIIDKFMHVSNK